MARKTDVRFAEKAVALMKEKRTNCAEAIITVSAERYGIDPTIARIGTPFGGGISANGDLCGIMTGGLIVIGLIFGRTKQRAQETKDRCYKIGNEYYRWFMLHFGRCTDLKGDPSVPPYDECYGAMREAVPYLFSLIDRNKA